MATFTLAQAQELLKVLKEYDSPSRNSRGGAIRTEPWQLVLACYLHQASVDDVISSETSDYIRKAKFAMANHQALQAFYIRKGYGEPSEAALTEVVREHSEKRAKSEAKSVTPRANIDLIRRFDSTTGSPRYLRAHHRSELRAYLADMLPAAGRGDNDVHEVTKDDEPTADNDCKEGSPDPSRPELSLELVLDEFCAANQDCFSVFDATPTTAVN